MVTKEDLRKIVDEVLIPHMKREIEQQVHEQLMNLLHRKTSDEAFDRLMALVAREVRGRVSVTVDVRTRRRGSGVSAKDSRHI